MMPALAEVPDLYAGLSVDVAWSAREASARIKLRMQRTAADIIEIGRELVAVKGALGHGRFLAWIDAEFGMSDDSARNFMRVAERFGDESRTVRDLPPAALYALAAPSTPDEVRDNVVALAQKGEKVTAETVRELKRKAAEATEALKEEKRTRAAVEGRAHEVMRERDKLASEALYLKSTLDQLQGQLDLARAEVAKPAAEPALREPVTIDAIVRAEPQPVNALFEALRALWRDADTNTRRDFLAWTAEAP